MPYLTYHDADIDEEAVSFFDDGCWLNDKCIDLYLEYLTHTIPPNGSPEDDIFISSAAMTFFLANLPSETDLLTLAAPQFNSASVIFTVINNNTDTTVALGGSHWSLMIYVRDRNACLHYDSASGMNTGPAKRVAKKLFDVGKVLNKRVPQQRNGNECGLYVLSIAEHIYRKLIEYKEEFEHDPNVRGELKYHEELFEVEPNEIPSGGAMRRKCREVVATLKSEYDVRKGKSAGEHVRK